MKIPRALRICFAANPVAGLGGPAALKGSDAMEPEQALLAISRAGEPPSISRARRFFQELKGLGLAFRVTAPRGIMGGDLLEELGVEAELVDLSAPMARGLTTRWHTIEFVRKAARTGCDVLVFSGGDGTASDVLEALGDRRDVPVLGIPSGVKVYSGVFATGPETAALVIKMYAEGLASVEPRPVVDAGEESLREGLAEIRTRGELPTLSVPGLVQGSKEAPSSYDVEGVAAYLGEMIEDGVLYILGPGRTLAEVARRLGMEKTPYGVDAVLGRRVVGKDLDSASLEELVRIHGRPRIVLTPVAGTGFLIGRGNQQISPKVLRAAGREGIIVVLTPEKASRLDTLLVDTGDKGLDLELEGFYRALTGYREEKIVRLRASWRPGPPG